MPDHSFFFSLASRRSPSFAIAKCLSAVSSSPNTVGWNGAVSCSQIGDGWRSEAEVTALSEVDDDMMMQLLVLFHTFLFWLQEIDLKNHRWVIISFVGSGLSSSAAFVSLRQLLSWLHLA